MPIHFALLGRKRKYVKSKKTAKLREKRTSIAAVRAKLGQFDIFQTHPTFWLPTTFNGAPSVDAVPNFAGVPDVSSLVLLARSWRSCCWQPCCCLLLSVSGILAVALSAASGILAGTSVPAVAGFPASFGVPSIVWHPFCYWRPCCYRHPFLLLAFLLLLLCC